MSQKGYFLRANLSGANLIFANLSKANFFRVNLSYANFFRANLTEANLSSANLSGANLSGANFFRANLSGADLSGVVGLNIDQLKEVKSLYKAKLDLDLEREVILKYPYLLKHPEEK